MTRIFRGFSGEATDPLLLVPKKEVWTRQPVGPIVAPNLGGAFSKALTFMWSPITSLSRNVYSRYSPWTTFSPGGTTAVVNRKSRTVGMAAECTSNSQLISDANGYAIKTSNGSHTGELTILCYTKFVASTNEKGLFFQRHRTSPNSYVGFIGNNSNGSTSSGALSFTTGRSPTWQYAYTPSVGDAWHVFVGVREFSSGSNYVLKLYVDGTLKHTTPPAASLDLSGVDPRLAIGGIDTYTFVDSDIGECDVALVACWDRALNANQVSILSRNPWQIFE